MGKHRYALYCAGTNKILSVTDPLERSPEPVITNGVAQYHLQVVEDDAPVGPEVPEVELVPPGHAIWHTRRRK